MSFGLIQGPVVTQGGTWRCPWQGGVGQKLARCRALGASGLDLSKVSTPTWPDCCIAAFMGLSESHCRKSETKMPSRSPKCSYAGVPPIPSLPQTKRT